MAKTRTVLSLARRFYIETGIKPYKAEDITKRLLQRLAKEISGSESLRPCELGASNHRYRQTHVLKTPIYLGTKMAFFFLDGKTLKAKYQPYCVL